MKNYCIMQSSGRQLVKILKSAIKTVESLGKQANRAGNPELVNEFSCGAEALREWRKKIAAGYAISEQERNSIRMEIKHYYKLSACIA